MTQNNLLNRSFNGTTKASFSVKLETFTAAPGSLRMWSRGQEHSEQSRN